MMTCTGHRSGAFSFGYTYYSLIGRLGIINNNNSNIYYTRHLYWIPFFGFLFLQNIFFFLLLLCFIQPCILGKERKKKKTFIHTPTRNQRYDHDTFSFFFFSFFIFFHLPHSYHSFTDVSFQTKHISFIHS